MVKFEATCHEHLSVRQQGRGEKAARLLHAPGHGPGASDRIVELRARSLIKMKTIPAGDEHFPVAQQRRRVPRMRGVEVARLRPGSARRIEQLSGPIIVSKEAACDEDFPIWQQGGSMKVDSLWETDDLAPCCS